MSLALELAHQGQDLGDVPVGAVVVLDDQVVGRGSNRREAENDPTAHAELVALRQAAQRLGRWNLSDCTLYVTLEPCPMCMGAILMARLGSVVCGCRNLRLGAAGTVLPLHDFPGLGLRCTVRSGVLQVQCARLLEAFFQRQRENRQHGEVAESG